jgi:hypothetical protein
MRRELPQGPDRPQFCFWYADALDEGKAHDEALRQAHGMLMILRFYREAGLEYLLYPRVPRPCVDAMAVSCVGVPSSAKMAGHGARRCH